MHHSHSGDEGFSCYFSKTSITIDKSNIRSLKTKNSNIYFFEKKINFQKKTKLSMFLQETKKNVLEHYIGIKWRENSYVLFFGWSFDRFTVLWEHLTFAGSSCEFSLNFIFWFSSNQLGHEVAHLVGNYIGNGSVEIFFERNCRLFSWTVMILKMQINFYLKGFLIFDKWVRMCTTTPIFRSCFFLFFLLKMFTKTIWNIKLNDNIRFP